MKNFKLAWQAIVIAWPDLEIWQRACWVVFFVFLYPMALAAVIFSKWGLPEEKEGE